MAGVIFGRGGSNQSAAYQPVLREVSPDYTNQAYPPFKGIIEPPTTVATNRILDASASVWPNGYVLSRATAATYFDSTGVMQTAAANASRVEYQYNGTSWVLAGLLIEDTSTNDAYSTTDFANSGSFWTTNNVTLTTVTGVTTAPDGNTTVYKVTPTGALDPYIVNRRANQPSNGTWVNQAWYVKSAGAPNVWIHTDDGPTGIVWNFSSKSVVASAYLTVAHDTPPALQDVGNGWFRCSGDMQADGAWFAYVECGPVDSGYSIASNAELTLGTVNSANAIYVYGPQIELGMRSATSYIPNTTSATGVTRAADSASFTLAATATQLTFTFDDDSTQIVSGLTGGSTYTIPTTLNRKWIKYIDDNAVLGASLNITYANTLGALTQVLTGTVIDTATVNQALGALGQTATDAVTVAAVASQTLGALVQVATDAVLAQATTTQTLGTLGQSVAATNLDHAVVAQTLGALSQVAAGTVTDAITVSQNLGALTNATTGGPVDTAAASQTLGALVQAATAGVIDAATASQTLGALAQAATMEHIRVIAVDQTLGALGQAATDTVLDQATINQTLGALSQAAAATHPDSAVVSQNLGALTQSTTAGVIDNAAAAQTLGAIVQTATAGAVDAATAAQTLGALGQVATASDPVAVAASQALGALAQSAAGTVLDAATVNQTLGSLGQTATASSGGSGFIAAQTLAGLVQALTGTVVSHATIAQALGGLSQTTTGGPVARIGAYADALPALSQTATTVHVSFANVAQVLGALSQIATATGPGPANLLASQILGALGQVATSAAPERALAAQILGALTQSASARSTPPTHIHLKGRLNAAQISGQIGVSVGHLQGRLGQRATIRGQLE